jgi:hypothetical protein
LVGLVSRRVAVCGELGEFLRGGFFYCCFHPQLAECRIRAWNASDRSRRRLPDFVELDKPFDLFIPVAASRRRSSRLLKRQSLHC